MTHHFRRLFALGLLLTFCFNGCSLIENDNVAARYRIDLIVKTANADFWQVVKQGAEAAAKEFNVDLAFKAPENELAVDAQIDLIRGSIDEKKDAIVLAASDYRKLVPITEQAHSEGIPMVIIDSAVNTDRITSFIGTDNYDAGVKIGQQVVRFAGEDCHLAIMNFVKGAAPADQRESGLLSVLETFKGIILVDTLYCQSDTTLAERMTRELLVAHPEITVIAALNAQSAVGVGRVIDEMELTNQIMLLTMDNSAEEIELLEAGIIQSTVVQNPFAMGYLGVKTAVEKLQGKTVKQTIDTGSTVIDKDNLYTTENQKLLFPLLN